MGKLTGRTRYRSERRWFGSAKLVLQVEEEVSQGEYIAGHFESRDWLKWRDARVEDLSELFLIETGLRQGGKNG